MTTCFNTQCSKAGKCMGGCEAEMYDHDHSIDSFSYSINPFVLLKELNRARSQLKYHKRMMWIAWCGWVITAVVFMYFVG